MGCSAPRHGKVFEHIDSSLMSLFMNTLLEAPFCPEPPLSSSMTTNDSGSANILDNFNRDCCFITQIHLQQLTTFVGSVLPSIDVSMPQIRPLESLVSSIKRNDLVLSNKNNSGQNSFVSNSSQRKSIINKVKSSANKVKTGKNSSELTNVIASDDIMLTNDEDITAGAMIPNTETSAITSNPQGENTPVSYEEVLILCLNNDLKWVSPGRLDEDKFMKHNAGICDGELLLLHSKIDVLNSQSECGGNAMMNHTISNNNSSILSNPRPTLSSNGDIIIEKRTRFSLSHDEGSIGNQSDNLEAISEAASNHSVTSSLDDVEQVGNIQTFDRFF